MSAQAAMTLEIDQPAIPAMQCPECGARYRDGRAHCSFEGAKLIAGTTDPLIGAHIDNYEVVELLGEGGMGAVYRVRHTLLEQEYALKLLSGELAANPVAAERFLREARAAAHIDHENVVKVTYSGVTSRGNAFLIMELLRGMSVAELVARGPLNARSAAAIARQVALGLAEIHRKGFVHRDVKSSNIMLVDVAGRRVAKILDLGVVGVLDPQGDNPRLTKQDHVLGTPQYMAPETLTGLTHTPAADLYGLGMVFYEMLAGRTPFDGSVSDVIWHQLNSQPDPLPPSDGFEVLVERLLQKQAEDRPRSALEVVAAIDHLLVHPPSELVSVHTPAPSSELPAVRGGPVRGVVIAAAAAALLAAAAIVYQVRGASDDEPPVMEEAITLPVQEDSVVLVEPEPPAPATAIQPSLVDPVEEAVPEQPRRRRSRRPAAVENAADVEPILFHVASDPQAAAVILQGTQLGFTPLDVTLLPDKRVALTLRHPGYADRKVNIVPSRKNQKILVRLDGSR